MGVAIEAVADDAARALARASQSADMIVVDPPRRGLEPALREAVAHARPRSVVYLSCEPETLARDLAHLARLGLAADSVTPIDMIPLTAHVEALAVVRPAAAQPARVLARDGDLVLLDKPPHADAFELGPHGGRALVDMERGASGVAAFDLGPRRADAPSRRVRVRCFVSGVARKRGHVRASGVDATYSRVAVLSGHSELVVEAELRHARGLSDLLDRLAAFGHPPLGDARRSSRAALRHAFDVRGIDRPAVHVEWAAVGAGERAVEATAPLAPDLALARARLDGQAR
jgi:23S rRNA (uracil1939-C5)-methyltransferase